MPNIPREQLPPCSSSGDDVESRRLLNASAVRHLCGFATDMTLWRAVHDAALGFPQPIYIRRRRFWPLIEIRAWLERQAEKRTA